MFLDARCPCRICRLRSNNIAARIIDGLFRDILLTSYGADITKVWKRERSR